LGGDTSAPTLYPPSLFESVFSVPPHSICKARSVRAVLHGAENTSRTVVLYVGMEKGGYFCTDWSVGEDADVPSSPASRRAASARLSPNFFSQPPLGTISPSEEGKDDEGAWEEQGNKRERRKVSLELNIFFLPSSSFVGFKEDARIQRRGCFLDETMRISSVSGL